MATLLSSDDVPIEIVVDPDFKIWAESYVWYVRTYPNTGNRYAARWSNETRTWLGMHIEAWQWKRGRVPDGRRVDHVNGQSLDNRFENLRLATVGQNNANRRVFKNSTTGMKGVSQRADGKYVARIGVDGRRKFLGAFTSLEEAAEAYDRAAQEQYGEFARTNTEIKDASNNESW